MRVLVACEFSARVRDAFIAKGHDAYSCDYLPSLGDASRHYQTDVEPLLKQEWDLVIAHPPCTYLCNSGVRWLHRDGLHRMLNIIEGSRFFTACLNANAKRVAVENPIPHKYAMKYIGVGYSQVIHPWQFGSPEKKSTCLWLRNLPLLRPTKIVKATKSTIHKMPPGPFQARLRSLTFHGIANAMADQWG